MSRVISTTDELPGYYPVRVYQGETFRRRFTYEDEDGTPVPMPGWTGVLRAATVDAEGVETGVVGASNSTVTLGESDGSVEFTIDKTVTEDLEPGDKGGRYDLFVTNGDGEDVPLLAGPFTIVKRVTGA